MYLVIYKRIKKYIQGVDNNEKRCMVLGISYVDVYWSIHNSKLDF